MIIFDPLKSTDINKSITDTYFDLIKNLSPDIKLNLIEKLTKTLKGDFTHGNIDFKSAFGAWKSDESADEIILKLRNNRNFNRQTEII